MTNFIEGGKKWDFKYFGLRRLEKGCFSRRYRNCLLFTMGNKVYAVGINLRARRPWGLQTASGSARSLMNLGKGPSRVGILTFEWVQPTSAQMLGLVVAKTWSQVSNEPRSTFHVPWTFECSHLPTHPTVRKLWIPHRSCRSICFLFIILLLSIVCLVFSLIR